MEQPGETHHARFMAKALYIGKITMSCHQLPANNITRHEVNAVKRMAYFISLDYVKYWLETPLTTAAPRNDLQFWKDMKYFEVMISLAYFERIFISKFYGIILIILFMHLHIQEVDAPLATEVQTSICRHMWYLTEELVVLALL